MIWVLFGILFFPVVKSLFPITIPFLVGLALALIAEPGVSWLSRKCAIRRSIAAALGILCVFSLSFTLLTLLLSLLLRQINHLSQYLPVLTDTIMQGTALLQQWLLSLAERAPDGMQPVIKNTITSLFDDGQGVKQHFVDRLPQLAGSALGRLSSGFIGAVTTILSAFMISARLPKLKQWIQAYIPLQVSPAIKSFRTTLGRWIIAQGKLAGIAFVFLWLGFMILNISHPFLWAALITCVDILPILGVGTVLLPWSLVSYLQADSAKALGLIGIFVTIWLVRSVLEPKLVGKELGLDPLITLLCIYAGFRLWGIVGMLLSPVAAVCLIQLQRAGKPCRRPEKSP